MAWLDLNWSPFTNPGGNGIYHVYHLYSLERAMDLLGRERVGRHPWYQEGAEALLARQRPVRVRRNWEADRPEVDAVFWDTGAGHGPSDLLDTCFALLFLRRATKGLRGAVTGG